MAELTEQPVKMDAATRESSRPWLTPALMVQVLVILVVLGIYYQNVFDWLFYVWKKNSDWSHGFIIPFFGLYYLYLHRDRMPLALKDGSRLARGIGILLLLAGFALFMRSVIVGQNYPKLFSLVITVMGIVVLCCGWPLARWSWFAVAFLVFALPLPTRLYEQMTIPLREVAADVSAVVLGLVPEMEAEASGTIVNTMYKGVPGTPLDIERACSGMRLLITMSALGVAMAFIHRRPIWQRMIMILACVPIAVFCNFVRVTTTGFLVVFERDELAHGTPHTLLGLGMLFLAFALYGGISYILGHMFVDAGDAGDDESEAIVARPSPSGGTVE